MSSDWTRMVGRTSIDDKLNALQREHIDIPMTYYGDKMPDSIALQVETARKLLSAISDYLDDEEIPIDKNTFFEFLENKAENEGKY